MDERLGGRSHARFQREATVTALPTEPTRSNNLPVALTSFVGRARELAELRALLATRRLLTLAGAGGCGKSRLALQVATGSLEDFPGGAWWVELAPVDDAQLIGPLVAQVFGVRPLPGQDDVDAVVSYLAQRRALVVLDNCEHLLDEAARVAERIARGCPDVRVVATSREPLRAEGETEWRVPSLSLPERELSGAPDDGSDAIRLFVERAAHIKPDFNATDHAAEIAAICRQLDGIPLAIELAAARLRTFSAEEIASGLDDRFRLLVGGLRTAPARQQTLRASVDWSHDLLSDEERTVFRRLGVFMGGFTFEAAAEVCSDADFDPDRAKDLLSALVEKSLVQADQRAATARYRLLETVRQYALDRLEQAGEAPSVRDRHRDFFVDVAEKIAPELLTPRQPEGLNALDPEAANFALAIEWAAGSDSEKALQLSVALTLWWRLRGLFAQGEAAFTRALDAAPEPSVLRARALWGRAFLLIFAGAFEAAFPAAQLALETAEQVGDDGTAARTLWLLGVVQQWPDPVGARSGLERARELAAASGDEFALLHATQGLAMSYTLQDEHRLARPFHEEALALAERLGQQDAVAWYWAAVAIRAWVSGDVAELKDAVPRVLAAGRRAGDIVTETTAIFGEGLIGVETGHWQSSLEAFQDARDRTVAKGAAFVLPAYEYALAIALAAHDELEDARAHLEALLEIGAGGWAFVLGRAHVALAEVARALGDPRRALAAGEEGLEVARRIGDRPVAGDAQLVLGRLAITRGEWAEAKRLIHEALNVSVEDGTPRLPAVLEALAAVAAGVDSYVDAARILGAADRAWSEAGLVPWSHQRSERGALERRVREALAGEFDAAYAQGRDLTRDEAVAFVRRSRGERKRPSTGWESLTPTELEVARHAAAGLTNPEIAERMFVSRDTVRTHLSHIFAKLGIRNRSELAGQVAARTGAPPD